MKNESLQPRRSRGSCRRGRYPLSNCFMACAGHSRMVGGWRSCPSSLRHFLHPPAQVETSGPVLRCKQKAQVCFCCKSAHSSIAVGAFLLGGSFLSWCKTLQGSSKTRNSLRRKRSLIEGLHRGEQKTGALYPPASSHIFSIARKLGHNVLILFHNIPSSLPQLV